MRILFAPKEVAGQVSVLSHELRNLGVSAFSLAFSENKFGYTIDKTFVIGNYPEPVKKLVLVLALIISIFVFDVFHFQAAQSFLFSYRDLAVLKKIRRRIIMHLHGSEVRNPDYVTALGAGRKN